jgi:hypothetical protein
MLSYVTLNLASPKKTLDMDMDMYYMEIASELV